MTRNKKNRPAPSGPGASNLADHAGPDIDQENLEKLARSAQQAAGATVASNGGEPPDEVIRRNFLAIEVCLAEIDSAARIMQKARADLSAAEKTAKTDLGSKGWVQSLKTAVQKKRQADKGGTGEMVTEHRQIGRALRVMEVPLAVQYNLFPEPATLEAVAQQVVTDQELAGYQAARNSEPAENNPWQPGTEHFVNWATGHGKAQHDMTEELSRSAAEIAH